MTKFFNDNFQRIKLEEHVQDVESRKLKEFTDLFKSKLPEGYIVYISPQYSGRIRKIEGNITRELYPYELENLTSTSDLEKLIERAIEDIDIYIKEENNR